MAHYRASDSKREQFRRYLEKAGVVDSLTSVLVSLYEQPEKPTNALEYVKQHLGAVDQTPTEIDIVQQEIAELREKCTRLTEENKELKDRLQLYEPAPEEGAAAAN